MFLTMDCNKSKTVTLTIDINSWPNWLNDNGGAWAYAQPINNAYQPAHFRANFGNVGLAIRFERAIEYEYPPGEPVVLHITVDAHVTTTIDTVENTTITNVTDYRCGYGDDGYWQFDFSMTGTITIELANMNLWQYYTRQNESAGGDAISWGYPNFPYQSVGFSSWTHMWYKSNVWKDGPMAGHEMSIGEYVWRYGGGDTGHGDTTVTFGGSFTVDGTEVTLSDTGTIGTGAPHYMGLGCNVWCMFNGAEESSTEVSYTAVLTVGAEALPYLFNGVDYTEEPENYYGIGCHVEGDANGNLTINNQGFDPEGAAQVIPVVYVPVTVYPELKVAANGRILPVGSNTWPDTTEYPPVKIRPLWRSSDVPPPLWYGSHSEDRPPFMPFWDATAGASIELTGGAYSANLSLQRIDLIVHFASRNDDYASQFKYQYFRNEHTLGVVLEQFNAGDYTDGGTEHWLDDAHQLYDGWRVMSQDAWLTKPAKVQHKATASPPLSYISRTNWTLSGQDHYHDNTPANGDLTVTAGAGGANLTKTLEPADEWDYSEWRYLQFAAAAGSSGVELTITKTFEVGDYDQYRSPEWVWTEHTKTWVVPVATGSGGLCILDLVAPDSVDAGRQEYDTTAWAFDKTTVPVDGTDARGPGQIAGPTSDGTKDETATAPGHLFGVGRLKEVVIHIPANQTVQFLGSQTPYQLAVRYYAASNETDRATLTVLPHWQLSNTVSPVKRWTYQGDSGWEKEPEYWRFHPEGKRVAFALVNYKQALDIPFARFMATGYRQTGFPHLADLMGYWDKNNGQDWELTDVYETDSNNTSRVNDAIPALALSPCKWQGSNCTPIRDIDVFTAAYELEARLPCDLIRPAPGGGDPQEANDYTYPYYFYAELGARLHGLTHHVDTYKAYPGATVGVYRGVTKVNNYVSNRWAYWRSDPLYTAASEANHTVSYEGMTAPVDMVAWPSRYTWISLIGLILGGGAVDTDFHKPTNQTLAITCISGGLTFHKSPDNGRTWASIVMAGITNATRAAVAVPPQSSFHGAAVASVEGTNLKVRQTGDWGESWNMVTVTTGVSNKEISLRYNETRGQLSLTYSKDGSTFIIESPDDGQTWGTPKEIIAEETDGAILAIPTDAMLVHARVDNAGNLTVSHSGDRGENWT